MMHLDHRVRGVPEQLLKPEIITNGNMGIPRRKSPSSFNFYLQIREKNQKKKFHMCPYPVPVQAFLEVEQQYQSPLTKCSSSNDYSKISKKKKTKGIEKINKSQLAEKCLMYHAYGMNFIILDSRELKKK